MNIVRSVKTPDNKYILVDHLGNKGYPATAEQVKELIKNNHIKIIDLQIDKRGRLVSKKVVCPGVRKTYGPSGMGMVPLSWDEQVMILFYGLARLNQLTLEQKKSIIRYFIYLDTMDEEDLKALITDNVNWPVQRYRYMDTACRDKIIDFLHRLLTNQLDKNVFKA